MLDRWEHLFSNRYTVLVIGNGRNLCITFIGQFKVQYREYLNGNWSKLECSAPSKQFNPLNMEVEELESMEENERIDQLIKLFLNFKLSVEQEHVLAKIFTTKNPCFEIQKYPTSGTETQDSSSTTDTEEDSDSGDCNNNTVQVNLEGNYFRVTLSTEGDIKEVRRIMNPN